MVMTRRTRPCLQTKQKKRKKPKHKEKESKKVANALKVQTLKDLTLQIHEAAKGSPTGKSPYGFVQNLVDGIKDVCPWATSSIIDKAYKKRKAGLFDGIDELDEQSNENAESESVKKFVRKEDVQKDQQ